MQVLFKLADLLAAARDRACLVSITAHVIKEPTVAKTKSDGSDVLLLRIIDDSVDNFLGIAFRPITSGWVPN